MQGNGVVMVLLLELLKSPSTANYHRKAVDLALCPEQCFLSRHKG